MSIVELFLDKRGDALGNTFLSEGYEEAALRTTIIGTCWKRSRSWAYSKSRPEFPTDDSVVADRNVPGEGTAHCETSEQPMMTAPNFQQLAYDQPCTNVFWHAIPSPDYQSPEEEGTIHSNTIHVDIQPPTIQCGAAYAEGFSQQNFLNKPLPNLVCDIWQKDLEMGGGLRDGVMIAPRLPSSSILEVLSHSLGHQNQASEMHQASEDTKQAFLDFVEQQRCRSRQKVQSSPQPCWGGPHPWTSWSSSAQQIQSNEQQPSRQALLRSSNGSSNSGCLGESSSSMQLRESAMSSTVLPAGLVSRKCQIEFLVLSEVISAQEHVQTSQTCGPNENFQEDSAHDVQDPYLNKFKTLGHVEKWQLDGHPEIPEGCTVMVRNVAENVSVKKVLDQLALLSVGKHIQCFYMPCTFNDKRHISNGYFFINFDSESAAEMFTEAWNFSSIFQAGQHGQTSKRTLNISRARVQGLRENLLKWSTSRTSRIRNKLFRPILFNGAMQFTN